jgi:hypothetical protein
LLFHPRLSGTTLLQVFMAWTSTSFWNVLDTVLAVAVGARVVLEFTRELQRTTQWSGSKSSMKESYLTSPKIFDPSSFPLVELKVFTSYIWQDCASEFKIVDEIFELVASVTPYLVFLLAIYANWSRLCKFFAWTMVCYLSWARMIVVYACWAAWSWDHNL